MHPARPSLFMPLICQKPAKRICVCICASFLSGFVLQFFLLPHQWQDLSCLSLSFAKNDLKSVCIVFVTVFVPVFSFGLLFVFGFCLPGLLDPLFMSFFCRRKAAIIAYPCILIWIFAMHRARLFLFMPFICQKPAKSIAGVLIKQFPYPHHLLWKSISKYEIN